MATGAEGNLSLGSAQTGFYVQGGAAQLTGVNVNNNSRISGSTGAYWTVYSNEYGVLKMGANMTGLHYAQNQRYFTIGQGGYFSPDSYLLLNAPFTWQARPINRFVYTIKGSLAGAELPRRHGTSWVLDRNRYRPHRPGEHGRELQPRYEHGLPPR